ncbi:hypothetical protein Bcav_2827 [Beutenbergia cavernae DSM 12333]|uniref:Uncharacterized protein n=1 Tax=Beutenbergia cavernae (strain ATCC BAA-8 / DSM 12333 / CCUG 43141 / JCM 11478 / NBRC 16432 / NCIMB 13614 / HKI 0122) TaxID=471853 RepID=C5BYH2_BEUC1|nr:hypothetical protein [Beutenbergia cavernae]ACQ81072.1 hypothetical protein Bcav_2827 [Beutenbergia cavernae DSM 12333]
MPPEPPESADSAAGSDDAGRRRSSLGSLPVPLRVALLLLLVQVAALTAFGVLFVVDLLRGVGEPLSAVGLAIFSLGLAALLGAGARALARGRRWPRGPVVTWQLLLAAVGISQIGANPVLGGAVVVLGIATLVLLLVPSSLAATQARGTPSALL